MNKKLIALAVAAALVPAAAMADSGNVTIYGKMDVSFDNVNAGKVDDTNQAANASAKSAGRVNGINSNQSFIGFKGAEDLGNGLSGIWQVETLVSPDTNATGAAQGNTFSSRNSFVGLSSKTAGTALLGRHDTPYKLATRRLDAFADGIADNRSIMGGGANAGGQATFDGRNNNTLAYITPSFSGFHAAIGYVLLSENPANTAATSTNSDNTQNKAWSLAGIYDMGPVFASLAYEQHAFGHNGANTPLTTADAKEKAWKLGVGYKLDALTLGLAYEKLSDDLNRNSTAAGANGTCNAPVGGTNTTATALYTGKECSGNKNWYLSAKYDMGNNTIKAAYTKAGDRTIGSKTGADQWSLGVDHNFSKRTAVYALWTRLSNDTYGTYAIGGITSNGAYKTSNNQSPVVGTNAGGMKQDALSLGVRHSF